MIAGNLKFSLQFCYVVLPLIRAHTLETSLHLCLPLFLAILLAQPSSFPFRYFSNFHFYDDQTKIFAVIETDWKMRNTLQMFRFYSISPYSVLFE